jgi:hypothetical protein
VHGLLLLWPFISKAITNNDEEKPSAAGAAILYV